MKKVILTLIVFTILGGSLYFAKLNRNVLPISAMQYDVEKGEQDGDIIQQEDIIINLYQLESFYKNVRSQREDEIRVVIIQSNNKIETYELTYSDSQIKLYSDIEVDQQGRKQYKVKLYDSIKKVLKNGQVVYKLVNDYEERTFLSYKLN